MTMREPGEKLVTFPQAVAEEYSCAKRRLPFVEVEQSELIPSRMRPGARLNRRFVYVMCPARASGVIAGTLTTRIRFRGKIVHRDSVQRDLQPGRWVVDAFVTMPDKAMPGRYALETSFESSEGRFSLRSDFLVEEERKLLGRR